MDSTRAQPNAKPINARATAHAHRARPETHDRTHAPLTRSSPKSSPHARRLCSPLSACAQRTDNVERLFPPRVRTNTRSRCACERTYLLPTPGGRTFAVSGRVRVHQATPTNPTPPIRPISARGPNCQRAVGHGKQILLVRTFPGNLLGTLSKRPKSAAVSVVAHLHRGPAGPAVVGSAAARRCGS